MDNIKKPLLPVDVALHMVNERMDNLRKQHEVYKENEQRVADYIYKQITRYEVDVKKAIIKDVW